jgi:hypothetical protein
MRNYSRLQMLDLLIDLVRLAQWLAVLVLLAILLSWLFPARARAEEPAYWPPCDEAEADVRCPPAPRQPLPRLPPELQCTP